ncbi:CPBP family intramembrane glutamic endopeptidase [Robiginitomaculum antarcticum]|uniref:CPBP family intramembrane glutamic endopeptidase n=1 Tax=Robiginitomaculum antarcticum TaxID=437507 RepID=UPI00035EC70E|nr:CPBP family intramembrane glutamic endopeptidase [Robiginitomaculum antarcticum]
MKDFIPKSERRAALLEVTVVILIAFISKWALSLFMWRFAGPVSLLAVVGLLTLYMNRRGESWREYGLKRLDGVRSKLMVLPQMGLTLAAFAAAVAIPLFGGEVLGLEFMTETSSGVDDRWGAIEGNLPLLLLWLGIVWTAAAFGEEMFFRGYLISRLETAFSGFPFAPFLAVFFAAALFGLGHVYYQGLRGLIITGAIGLAFGIMFLLFKRNLWPIIFLHGVIDTLTMSAIYFGIE